MQNALAGSKGVMFFQKKWTERKPLSVLGGTAEDICSH
jgi:hypothetical protein